MLIFAKSLMAALNAARIAAVIYAALTAVIVAFQIALALGAPWGEYAMAGAFPGQLPPSLRVAVLVQALILAFFAAAVLARASIAFPQLSRASRWLVWLVVTVAAVNLALNLITPSAAERAIWAPVAFVLLGSALITARARQPRLAASALRGLVLAGGIACISNEIDGQSAREQERPAYRHAIDVSPMSPLFRIYAIHYTNRITRSSEIIVGPYYANIHFKDIGHTDAPGFIVGYRRYIRGNIHVDYQLMPQWDRFYEGNERKRYPLGFDLWNEFRLPYFYFPPMFFVGVRF